VMPGIHLAGLKGELACLSCHTDHRGRMPDLAPTAGRTCAECHAHESIVKEGKHHLDPPEPLTLASGSKHFFKQAYSHKKHFDLFTAANPLVKDLPCKLCHDIAPPSEPNEQPQIVLKWSGCAGGGCHINPQDQYLEMPLSVGAAPELLASWNTLKPKTKHLNAMFEHSPGHLRYECSFCHTDIRNSLKIGNSPDKFATKVLNCFECHEHQAEPMLPVHSAGLLGASVAFAQEGSASPATAPSSAAASAMNTGAPITAAMTEKKIVACAECHEFHAQRGRPEPIRDFPNPAPGARPHLHPGLTFAAYLPAIVHPSGQVFGVAMRRIVVNPWWMGGLALVATGTMFGAWIRFLPRLTTLERTVGNVAPQRTSEVPALDDTYQSTVPRLYVVGETAGTASINLAMRSGRQSIEFIANLLKFEKPQVAPDIYDVAIIGCGPAGISASATAISRGLKYVAIEKMTAISTIKAYPRGKFVQATSIDIAEYGSFFMEGDTSKESLIATWEKIIAQTGVKPNEREEVSTITRVGDLFEVKSSADHVYKTRFVVLAIGVRGSARHLGLPN
jgi:hypothetical protein